ncbi:zinc finger BED domain-containing protein 5-like [Onthophagus taurus]|uniref:zinc finger BED domain-containing protein 5-like n=1 Tax=Onthophagus taurus TaxID=166361 RepID=UPI0039BDF07E
MSITEFVLKRNFISLNVITMNCTALFLVHTIGQRVTTAAGNIAEAVYNLNWFEADVSTRKDILILLCMSQKPLVLGAPLFGPYSHTAAVKIMDRWLQLGCSKRKVNKIERTATYEIIEDETSSKPVNKKARKTRKYDKEYLKLGFSWSGNEKEPIPLCVICFENLANENLNQSQKVMRGLTGGDNQKILETSYRVSLLIAKCGAADTIGETLIKPAAKIMAEVMIGDKAKQTLDRVSLSNNTVHRRIIDMANNVKQMLLSDISQNRYYALQVDESTDITNFANLMAFVRYEKNQEIQDEFLFCQPLLGHTTG